MTPDVKQILVIFFILGQTPLVGAETNDAFQFFEEEAKVITASRIPESRQKAAATTYVVSREDIQASGAQNLWTFSGRSRGWMSCRPYGPSGSKYSRTQSALKQPYAGPA